MKTYLEVFETCKQKIESDLMRLKLLWKDSPSISRCSSIIQSSLFTSEYQFLNCYLSYFLPAVSNDEGGIEIGISFSQEMREENGSQIYSSQVLFDEQEDVIIGNKFYVSSDICSTTGRIILENPRFEIFVLDPEKTLFDCIQILDKIVSSFQSQLSLIEQGLISIENNA